MENTIQKNIFTELGIIMAILLILSISGAENLNDDRGSNIMLIGLMWAIASIVRMHAFPLKIISLFLALGTIVLGYGIFEFGIFLAISMVGIYSILISTIIFIFSPNKGSQIFFVGALLTIFGYLLGGYSMPTDPKKYYHPITYQKSKWEVFISCSPTNGSPYDERIIGTITGTEQFAYQEAHKIINNWKLTNINRPRILDAHVNLIKNSCPYEHMNNYTYTHSLETDFEEKFRPKWASLHDTEN